MVGLQAKRCPHRATRDVHGDRTDADSSGFRKSLLATIAVLALAVAGSAWPAVGVNKSFTPNSVTAGQVSTLTLIFGNPNDTAATAVGVTDTLPANFVVANPLTVTTNTCGFAVGATPGLRPIVLSGGTLPAVSGGVPGQCTLTINVVSSVPNTYLNSIPANAVTSSQGTNAQSTQATLVVSAPANVTGTKVFAPGNVHGNQTGQVSFSRLTITLTNPNAIALTNAAIVDALPATVTIATPANAATTCGAGVATPSAPATNPATLALTGGTIPANGACTIAVNVVARNPLVSTQATSTNAVPANALTTAQGATSSAFQGNVVVQTGATIAKAFAPNPIPPGGATVSLMTFTINNWNATPLTPITFTDAWGGTMTVSGVPTTTCSGVLTSTANSVTLTGATLAGAPAGPSPTSCTITVPVVATATTTNTIAAGSIGGVAFPAVSSTLVVTPISGTKTFTIPAFQTGTTTMTLTLRNTTASPATITTVNDNLNTMGAGFTIAAPGTVGGSCGSSLTSPPGGTLITLTGGIIPANSFCTVTLLVNIGANATTGNRTNTVAVNGVVTSIGNNAQTITGQVNVERALALGKAFVPATVQAGVMSRLTVTLTRRANAAALTGIAFADALTTMGAGFVVATPALEATTCTGGTVTAAPGATTFSLAGGALAGGAAATACTVSVNVMTPAAGAPATYVNTIPANAVTTTQGVTNAGASGNLVLSPPTSVTVNKSFAPTVVAVGGTSVMTIQVRNNNAGAIALTGVGLIDNLPPGMIIANPPAPTFTGTGCSIAGGSITAPNNGTVVTLTNASVNVNAICSLNVTVRAAAAGSLINTIVPNAVSSAQGVTNPLLGSATLAASGTVNLSLAKTNSATTVTAGGATTYTIVVSNAGPNIVAGMGISDLPPAGVTFGAWTCVASPGSSCGAGSGPIADTVTIPSGGSITYTVPATIAPNATGTLTNTVNAIVPGSVINIGSTTASDTDTVVAVTSLAITKDDGATTYLPGGTATYVMVLTNGGPSDATNVGITDTLPAGVTQNGAASCVAAGLGALCGTISNLGSGFSVAGAYVPVVPGASLTYTLPVSFGAGMVAATITNTVTATNAASSGPGSTASAADTNSILLFAPALGKSIVPATIAAGGTATLTLTLGNPNAGATTLTAPFTDNMPAGVTTASGNSGTCTGVTVNATSIARASGSLLPAGGCTIIVSITSSTPGTVTNTTSGLQTGVGTAPAASAPLTVTVVAPTLAKTISPATIAAGGAATLTLTLGNTNATPQTLNAPFTDNMPAGVTTTSANTGTCTGVTVTAPLISMAAGTAIPAGGCTIVVTVTSSTPGTVTNTTSVLQTGAGNAPAASAPLTVTEVAPTLLKSILPATIVAGGTSTLAITVGQANAVPVTLTAPFTDAMPAGVTTASANTGTCTPVTVTPTLLTLPGGSTIPAGGCTIIVTVTSTTPGTVTNTTSTMVTAGGTAPSASAPLTVTAVASALGKAIVPSSIVAGGAATLSLTLSNTNATPLTLTLPFVDAMPAGVTTTTANTGTCAGVTVAPTLVTMAQGSSIPPAGCTIVVGLTSATPGTVTNTTGTLTTNAGATPPASAPLTVTAAAPALTKTIAPATIGIGGSATLTLTLGNTNATPQALTAAFTDPMPAGVTTTSANTGTCAGVTVTPTLITMPAGASIPAGSCTIVVTVTSSTPGTVTNTTTALQTAAGTAPSATAPLTVTAVDAALSKSILPATIPAGGSANLTITLANPNASALTLAAPFTDAMPAGVTTTSANTGTCAGVTVTSTLITMPIGTTVQVGGCTIVVAITSTTPGTVTNTTSALLSNAGAAPPASAPLTVTAVSSALTKTITPATIAVGGTATLTLVLGNANATPQALTAAFTDAMPAGVSTTSGNSGSCPGVTVVPALITMPIGATIPPGGCTIVVTVTSSTPGAVTNTTSVLQTAAGVTPPASAALTVTAVNAALTKAIVPGTIPPRGLATLTLTLGNANAVAVTLTAPFTDSMPTGVSTFGGNTGSCTGVTVAPALITMATGSAIPPGGCTIVVAITSASPGNYINVTSVLQTGAGAAPAASAPLTVGVVPVPAEIPVNLPWALVLLAMFVAWTGLRTRRR